MSRALTREGRETLELLAVVGRPVTVAELHRFRAPAVNDSDRGWILVKAGLVAERNDDTEIGYVVGHPLIQETIYRGLSARATALHQRVARVR